MTQTIRKVEQGKGFATVSIYSHPNNARASMKDPETHWKYTVLVKKIPVQLALKWAVNDLAASHSADDTDDLQREIYHIASVATNGFVWEVAQGVMSRNNCKDLRLSTKERYHATKKNAMKVALSQSC